MKLSKLVTFLSVIVIAIACQTTSEVSKTKTLNKKPKEFYQFEKKPDRIYFTILQLNDVYEIAPIQGGKFAGMARVETVRQELLAEDPNTFTVLAGDFLNPSLLGTIKVDGERVRGKQMVEVMNAMNFDLVAFGNHEFDISYQQLQNRLNESNFEWISANVLHNVDGRAHYFQKVKDGKKQAVNDSFVQTVYMNGKSLNVGFISVCIPSNPRDYVTYGDIYIEAERSYNEVKSQSDIVLGLTHLEIDQDKEIAKMFPEIPLIMGGHEHKNSYDVVGNTKIAKADANAKTVYIHRFEYDPLTNTVKVKSELRTIDSSIEENPEVAKIVSKWQDILDVKLKEVFEDPYKVVYTTDTPLEARDTPVRTRQTNMGEVITKAMSHAYNDEVDCAFVNGGSIRIDDVLSGDITAVDIFRVLPYGGPVLKVKLKGNLLEEVLNYGENEGHNSGAYLQRYKAEYKSDNWYINDVVLDPEKEYTIVTSDYLLKGFDIPVLKDTNPDVIEVYTPNKEELAFDIRKAVVNFLNKL